MAPDKTEQPSFPGGTPVLRCEVCREQYAVKIEHRFELTPRKLLSSRSCESYFECFSLILTLTMMFVSSRLTHATGCHSLVGLASLLSRRTCRPDGALATHSLHWNVYGSALPPGTAEDVSSLASMADLLRCSSHDRILRITCEKEGLYPPGHRPGAGWAWSRVG
eukprot:756984-Hanusia_phi.AAC.3